MKRCKLSRPAQLDVAKIARGLMGRPAVQTCKSYVDVLPVIKDCDTKSKENMVKKYKV